jgi:hypothetical protein
MYRHLFRNRWIALAFVILMMTSAITLVGTEDGSGLLDHATAELHGQKQAFEDQAAELSKPGSHHIVIDADELETEDEEDELVDPGTGEDPTPVLDDPVDPTPDLDPTPAL